MPQTFVPRADQLEDLATLEAASAVVSQKNGTSEEAARDLTAKARSYASWDDMLSQSWSLSEAGLLAGRLDGRRIEIDLSEVIALPVMSRDEAWQASIRRMSVRVLPPDEEGYERMLLCCAENHLDDEEFESLEFLGIRDDLCAALQASSGRLAALAQTGINIAREEAAHPGHRVEDLPMQRADALEHARRFFKDWEVPPRICLEDRDDFPVPKMDDFLLYGLAFQTLETEDGTDISVYAISSYDTKQISGGDGDEISDALFALEASETGRFEDVGLGSVLLVPEGEIEDAYDDILEMAAPGFDM